MSFLGTLEARGPVVAEDSEMEQVQEKPEDIVREVRATLLHLHQLLGNLVGWTPQRRAELAAKIQKAHDAKRVVGKPDLAQLTRKEQDALRLHIREQVRWRGDTPAQRRDNPRKHTLPKETLTRLAVKAKTTPDRLLKSAASFFRWHPVAEG